MFSLGRFVIKINISFRFDLPRAKFEILNSQLIQIFNILSNTAMKTFKIQNPFFSYLSRDCVTVLYHQIL